MTSAVGLGFPKPLPISAAWSLPFALYSIVLSSRIVGLRVQTGKYVGSRVTTDEVDPLETAVRCQGNFLENVPLAFTLLGICELNGGNRKLLNYAMAALLAVRIAHAEFGLRLKGAFGTNGVGRPIGYFGSAGVVAGLSGYAAYFGSELLEPFLLVRVEVLVW